MLVGWVLSGVVALAAAQDPTEELVRRSGMAPGAVAALLANCDANVTSVNFCALYDQIAAELSLQRVVDRKDGVSPGCRTALQKTLAAWMKSRDSECRDLAQKEWGSGAMLAAGQAMCATAETQHMTAVVSAVPCR
jgi:uncharacterized protein YecT (DUF1311 family)